MCSLFVENAFLKRLGREAELQTRNTQTVPESGNEGGIRGEREEILLTETQKEKGWTGAFVLNCQGSGMRSERPGLILKAPLGGGRKAAEKRRAWLFTQITASYVTLGNSVSLNVYLLTCKKGITTHMALEVL